MSEKATQFTPVTASGIEPPVGPDPTVEGLVLGPWIARRRGATGPAGALLQRRENFVAPSLILTRRRLQP